MQRDTTKRFYAIHSWVGAVTAIFIFVIAFTGAVSVFGRPEIKIWAHEVSHVPVELEAQVIERLVRDHAERVPEGYLEEIQVVMPGVRRSPDLSIYFEKETELESGRIQHHMLRFDHDPRTLELVDQHEGEPQEIFNSERKDLADFLIKFHADLHLGDPIGLLITGLLGLTLFASIVTGVITHRKVLKEAFTFRPFRSLRLLFTDSHKVLGVWGMLFHGTIAFTGAFLGLAVVLLFPAAAFVSFEGDLETMVETYLPTGMPEKSGVPAEIQIAEVLEAARAPGNGPIVSAQILAGNDRNGVVLVNTLAGEGIIGETLRYRIDGTELESRYTQFSRLGGTAGPVLDAMFPLHFGNFGGLLVKFIWFTLGLGTAFLAVSGAMIWVERRAYGSAGSLSIQTYQRISRLTVGACAGCVLAVVALFHLQLLVLPMVEQTNRWMLGSFFGVWLLAIAWALLNANAYRTTRQLLMATGVLAAAVPLVNGLVTGNHLFNVFARGHWVAAGTDAFLLLVGLGLCYSAFRLPSHRPARKGRSVPPESAAQAGGAGELSLGEAEA